MFTVWYCVGMSLMYCDGKSWCCSSLEEAQEITESCSVVDHWWASQHLGGWFEIRNSTFELVWTGRKELQQLGLF